MKSTFKIICYITIIVFILLWINQFFAIRALYLSEKFQWQRLMDSVIEHSIDFYVRPYDMLYSDSNSLVSFNPDTRTITVIRNNIRHDFKMDSTTTQQELFLRGMYESRGYELSPINQLDSILRINISPFSSNTEFVSLKLDKLNNELDKFPKAHTKISKMIPSKNYELGFIDGESLQVYYNFPLLIFLKKAWNDILTICIISLLFIFFMTCIVYLFKFMRKLSLYQEDTMNKIVHNWKTPLSSIKTMIELLQKKSISPTDEKGIEKTKFILEEIAHLQTGSQQIMRALIDTIHIQIDRTEFNLKEKLLSLIEEEKTAHFNETISLNLKYSLPTTIIYASEFHLICAVRNLVDNAIKYGKPTPSIFIECFTEKKALIIVVKDDGPGIPKEKQKFIFDKYYQVIDKDSGKKRKGYGLGLNYVYNVIKAHKGKITVDSPPGKGCTFTIYLRKWKKK